MTITKRLLAALLAAVLTMGTVACGDDPGEDTLGDGEVNDQGD